MNFMTLFVVIIVPFLLYLSYLVLRLYIFFRIIKHKHRHSGDSIASLKQRQLYNAVLAEKMEDDTFEIEIEKHVTISGNLIKGSSNKLVIFAHGFQGTRWDMTKYAQWFFEEGWNMVFFDFRTCGESTGKIGSLGGLEVRDLEGVVRWSRDRLGEQDKLLLFGESVGAAVCAVYSSRDESVSAVIADSIYSSALKEVRSKLLRTLLPKWFVERVLIDVTGWIRFYPGYQISEMNPEYSLMRTSIPLLLVHGEADMQVPPSMPWTIFRKRRELAPTRIYLCKGAGFAGSWETNPKKYLDVIQDFLNDDAAIKEFSRLYS